MVTYQLLILENEMSRESRSYIKLQPTYAKSSVFTKHISSDISMIWTPLLNSP